MLTNIKKKLEGETHFELAQTAGAAVRNGWPGARLWNINPLNCAMGIASSVLDLSWSKIRVWSKWKETKWEQKYPARKYMWFFQKIMRNIRSLQFEHAKQPKKNSLLILFSRNTESGEKVWKRRNVGGGNQIKKSTPPITKLAEIDPWGAGAGLRHEHGLQRGRVDGRLAPSDGGEDHVQPRVLERVGRGAGVCGAYTHRGVENYNTSKENIFVVAVVIWRFFHMRSLFCPIKIRFKSILAWFISNLTKHFAKYPGAHTSLLFRCSYLETLGK